MFGEKLDLERREDLFFFGLHPIIGVIWTSEGVKIYFFGLHPIIGVIWTSEGVKIWERCA